MNPLRAILCLAWFIAGCLALAVVALHPRLRFRMTHWFGAYVSAGALRILGIRVVVSHYDRLVGARPCIIIANHQHLFDVFLMSYLAPPGTIAIGKKSILWIPLFGWLFHRAGNLLIDRQAHESARATMQEAHVRLVERGVSVVVMPEGTRSLGKGLLPFKTGAFHLAVGTQMPIVPLAISPFHGALNFWKWHAGTLRVEVLPPIPTKGLDHSQIQQLMHIARAGIQAGIAGFETPAASA